ncbi:MAG: hypothetical protein IT318_02255 [Anaerolineales bacterium]|nr:hypothetical protein [Anaerolineales bacterium]
MSEYQYYEWQTVDRLLTGAEQDAVSQLSSHIDVTASQAVVTYDWSDFKHDPRKVLARYFDAHLYFANWGTRILMFRFPAGWLDEALVAPCLVEDMIQLSTEGKSRILEFSFEEEPEWDNFEGELSGLVGLRNDLLGGDYRCLYLGWLKALSLLSKVEQNGLEEPPVPAGLAKLTPALRHFADFFHLDPHLIKSAAAASPAQAATVSDAALRKAIRTLTRAEGDDYLLRLLQGETGLSHTLRRRLQSEVKAPLRPAGGGRTAEELFSGARRAKRQDAERKAAEAEKRRIAALEKLAQKEEQTWQTVEAQLAERHWTYHAKAIEQLQQLRDLADHRKTRADFNRRLKTLRERHKERASIMKRLAEARLVSGV